jgi:hypothetical protein
MRIEQGPAMSDVGGTLAIKLEKAMTGAAA